MNDGLTIGTDEEIINREISRTFLMKCYTSKYALTEGANINELQVQNSWSSLEIQEIINHLESIKWIRCRDIRGLYITTGLGAREIEKRGLINIDKLNSIKSERRELLKHFADRYIAFNGYNVYTQEEFEKNYGKSYQDIAIHLGEFQDLGLFDRKRNRLTELGYKEFKTNTEYENISIEYENIQLLPPQNRGREFEKIIARLLKLENWTVQHSVKNENEENDIFLSHGRENYLVEVKWLKDPVEARHIRELIGKLTNRVGVAGIYFSSSGYTSGAVGQVREQMSNVVIHLFGLNDFKSIIERHQTFNYLLSVKHRNIVLSKSLIWS